MAYKKIIISGAGSAVAKSIIEHIRKKYYVIGIDSNSISKNFAKQYCDEFIVCPTVDSKNYLNFINKLLERADIFIPFIDEEILNLSKSQKKIKDFNKILISNYKTNLICNNKKIFQQFCFKNRILSPQNKKSKNYIVKPIFGRGSKNVFEINDNKVVKLLNNNKKFIIQQKIYGREYTVDALFSKKNKLVSCVSRERIVKNNVSLIGKISNEINQKKIINLISSKLDFKYLINFQFIKDVKGRNWLIEINPRISGSIIFSVLAGNDLIYNCISSHFNNKIKTFKTKNKFIFRSYQEKLI